MLAIRAKKIDTDPKTEQKYALIIDRWLPIKWDEKTFEYYVDLPTGKAVLY